MIEPTTFREAYEVLQRHAQELRNADEPSIDDLLSVVTESVAAYKVCKQRIDAVELALKEALADVGAESTSTGSIIAPKQAHATQDRTGAAPRDDGSFAENGLDDDVPF